MVFDNLIIRARDVAKKYGDEQVLTSFNIDIWKGGIFGILGMSGSGKTTAADYLSLKSGVYVFNADKESKKLLKK